MAECPPKAGYIEATGKSKPKASYILKAHYVRKTPKGFCKAKNICANLCNQWLITKHFAKQNKNQFKSGSQYQHQKKSAYATGHFGTIPAIAETTQRPLIAESKAAECPPKAGYIEATGKANPKQTIY